MKSFKAVNRAPRPVTLFRFAVFFGVLFAVSAVVGLVVTVGG